MILSVIGGYLRICAVRFGWQRPEKGVDVIRMIVQGAFQLLCEGIYILFAIGKFLGTKDSYRFQSWTHWVSVALAVALDEFFICCFCCSQWKKEFPFWMMRSALMILFAGIVMCLTTFLEQKDLIEYDYFGPTRIVGTEIEAHDFLHICDNDPRQPSCTYYPGFRAKYQVEFGREWACPNRQPSALDWCQTSAEYQYCTIRFICESEQCPDEKREKDRRRVSNCLREAHPLISNIEIFEKCSTLGRPRLAFGSPVCQLRVL